jgi:putative aldouronate transport system substrate-binding protein
VNKDTTVKEKFSSGRAGVVPLNWADVVSVTDALMKNHPDARMVYLSALKGPGGKAALAAVAGFDRITFIPRSSKHAEDTIKWINAKLDKDTFKLMAIGEEGKHHTFKDGTYTPILPIFNDERNQANNFLMGIDEKNYPVYWQARVRKDLRLFDAWAFMNQKKPDEPKVVDPLGIAPYMPEYSKNSQQLNTMLSDYAVKLIFGAEPLSGLDAFKQKYKAGGGDASYKEVNEWYTALKK